MRGNQLGWVGIGIAVGSALAGCSRQEPGTTSAGGSPKLFPIVVQLDWVAEPEHGGFYQALAKGYFADAGLDVRLDQGGPNGFGLQKVATGQAQFAQSDSTNVLIAIDQGLPLIHVGAVFQNDPSVLMLHADSPVNRFEDLAGRTIMARPEWAFLPYLRRKYGIDFTIVPQNFQVANFVADPNFIQQGFYIAEPYHIKKAGAPAPKFLYAWDAGFDAYTVIVAHRTWIAQHPAETRAFLAAYIRGWREYIEGDPTPAHALMKQVNPNNTDEFLAFSRQMIIDEKLVIGRHHGGTDQIGRVSPERFAIELQQLAELNIIKPGNLTVDQVVTTTYLP